MSNYLGLTRHQLENEIDERDDELSRLRAELEALKPVVEVRYTKATVNAINSAAYCDEHEEGFDNLKLTFHDGRLISAEVIGKESEG